MPEADASTGRHRPRRHCVDTHYVHPINNSERTNCVQHVPSSLTFTILPCTQFSVHPSVGVLSAAGTRPDQTQYVHTMIGCPGRDMPRPLDRQMRLTIGDGWVWVGTMESVQQSASLRMITMPIY